MAKLIKYSGVEKEISLESFEQIEEMIGGFFELVELDDCILMVSEDAIALKLPVNQKATKLAGQVIRGNVICASYEEVASN